MFYIHYQDKGPSGFTGQDCRSTMPWNKLFVYNSREDAEEFIDMVANQCRMPGRSFPRIVNYFDDEDGNVIHND